MPRRRSRGRIPRDLTARVFELAITIDAQRAKTARRLLAPLADGETLALGTLLSAALPALAPTKKSDLDVAASIAREGWSTPRDRTELKALLAQRALHLEDGSADVGASLRAFTRAEKIRIALREVLPRALGGADVDVTSAELAALADVTIDFAFAEATRWATERYGIPTVAGGARSTFVVLGMGKLGGDELNPGSDVDLIYFYDTDEGDVRRDDGTTSVSLHEYWTRVARRMTSTLEDMTDGGFAWRVDLRLRPEGGSGPLVNSVAAAERYYEAFGRSWERAALLRARPVAGDLALGAELLASLSSFVWRRTIDPTIAAEMSSLVVRSRAEIARGDERDLKLGEGGIREAEFFVQTLQLVWGGKEPSLRVSGTLPALARLEAKGLVTSREAVEITDGYLALRRAEHAVQSMTGLQTHVLPRNFDDLGRLARMLGYEGIAELDADLDRHRRNVAHRFRSLLPEAEASANAGLAAVLAALEAGDRARLGTALQALSGGRLASLDEADRSGAEPITTTSQADSANEAIERLATSIAELGKRPDDLLGTRTRDAFPGLAEVLVESLLEAPDPLQAAKYVRIFFERLKHPSVYMRLVARDPPALRRLVAVVGASAFVGDALLNNPGLGDRILFSRDVVTLESARDDVLSAASVVAGPDEDPDEALIGALRLAKTSATIEVALALLAGEFSVREVSSVLTAVAVASLEVAARRASGDDIASVRGFAVLAMGKLGSDELSFGSDLDVLFLYDPNAAPDGADPLAHFTRRARKVITLISTFHGAGPGYELDTRLRPSGNQGLLVTSLDAFARYHGFESAAEGARETGTQAAVWERMAVTRARAVAGDITLGDRAVEIAQRGAARSGARLDPSVVDEVRRIRARVEREVSLERRGVRDLKLGRGGLLDIEFVVQLLTVRAASELGYERAPWGQGTSLAIVTLEALDLLTPEQADTLATAYRFLRRLEVMIRVVRADASHALEERSSTLHVLGRRMGIRERSDAREENTLLARYVEITEDVRRVYEEILSVASPPPSAVDAGAA